MLPKRKLNIYPKNESNVQALIEYYFNELELNTEGVIDFIIKEKNSLQLNQFEFLCRKIKEGYSIVFRTNLNGKIALKNLLTYSVDALTKNKSEWNGSKNRLRITQEFLDFVMRTEVNNNYLERYN